MLEIIISVSVSFLFVGNAFCQKTPKEIADDYIQSEDLNKHLTVLASDAYLGRETGKEGQKMAAKYLCDVFEETGCDKVSGMPSFEQTFGVVESIPAGELTLFNTALTFKDDFLYLNSKRRFEYVNLSVHTNVGAQANAKMEVKDRLESLVLIDTINDIFVRDRIDFIRSRGVSKNVSAIILLAKNYDDIFNYYEHSLTGKSMRLSNDWSQNEVPIILVNLNSIASNIPKEFSWLAGKGKPKKRKQKKRVGLLTIDINNYQNGLTSSNVLAFIPGNDSILSKEVVVITAHYDHIGVENGVVYNGADDDGTGTVALLELAEAFVQLKRFGEGTKRSILIMPVSGEEKGLLGSSYFTQFPPIPLASIVTDLNIDMIGRDDFMHEKDTAEYIYIIGSNMLSDDLHDQNELANEQFTQLKLDYTFNAINDPNKFYYRSDHYNFAKNNIPCIFYFSGIHDDYHQPTDDIEKIDFLKVERVTKLVFHTAVQIANTEIKPRLKK